MKRFYLLLLIVACLCNSAFAQTPQLIFEHLTVRDGLSSSAINAIIQDRKGFLWIGTENGLNRYDGISFKTFKHNPTDTTSLSHNFIWSISEDQAGIIWIGTDGGGLNRFNPATEEFTRYFFDPEDTTSISSNIVQFVFVDRFENIWAGTWGSGLNKYNRETDNFTRFIHHEDILSSLSNNKIFNIFEDSRGNLWIATDGGGASILDRETLTFRHFIHEPDDPLSIGSDIVLSIYEDSRGYIWFGTYSNVISRYDYQSNTFHNYRSDNSTFTGKITWTIIEDRQGIIWIGTLTTGLYLFDYQTGGFTHINHNPYNLNGINSNYIRSLFEDASGILWIGTVMNGLNKTDRKPQKFHYLTKELNNPNSLAENSVSAIMEDRDGYLWFGTLSNGLSKYNPAQGIFTHFGSEPHNPDALNGELIKYLYEDGKGTIWIGTYFSVLNLYDKATNKFIHLDLETLTDYPPGANNIRVIHEDEEGIMWLGVHGGGIIRYDRIHNSFMRFSESDTTDAALSSDYIVALAADDENTLWIGTHGGGINRLNMHDYSIDSYIFDVNNPYSISDNIITDLYIDSNGNLWVGTYSGGLNRFNKHNKTFTRFRENDGLATDLVCSIIEDDHGNLWLSTGYGITKFNPFNYTFTNYDHSDGIRQGECNPGSHTKTRDGRIYFGGIEGVTYFHPDNVYDNTYNPPVVITTIKINNIEQSRRNPAYTETIVLSPKDYNLSVEFASLDFTQPLNNQYTVLLDGLDLEWNYIGNRRFINYTNFAPGKYTLNIKGSNNNGVWSEIPAQLHIIVEPPFYVTWWFRSISVITIISLLYYSRVSTLKKERRSQEKISKHLIASQEQERRRIAAELHDSLGQNLLIIKNRALLGLEKPDTETLREQIAEISDLTSQTIDEVREISYNLRPYQLDRLGLKEAIDSIIGKIIQTTGIACSVSIDALNRKLPKDSEVNLYRIVQELLNNIVKHSGADSISINAVYEEEKLTLSVADNGKGFDPERLRYDSKNGQGFGLVGMHERVKILKGNIIIQSSPGTGTTVTLTIPIEEANNE